MSERDWPRRVVMARTPNTPRKRLTGTAAGTAEAGTRPTQPKPSFCDQHLEVGECLSNKIQRKGHKNVLVETGFSERQIQP